MRLRDACVLIGAFLVLFDLTGCNRNNNRIIYTNPADSAHIKPTVMTPHAKAQNEVALAQEYITQGKFDVALDDLQKAIKLDPSSFEAYTVLGILDEKLNRLTEADAAYAKSVKLAPNNGNVLNNYGAWLCRSGHPNEADPQFRKAIADPFYKTPAIALGNAATCANQAGNAALAESYDRQVLALDPGNVAAMQSLAEIEYKRGDFMRARGFIERVFATGQNAPESLDLAAHIEEKLGDQDSARNYRTRLSSDFPEYTQQQF